jgi:hypothetical protein
MANTGGRGNRRTQTGEPGRDAHLDRSTASPGRCGMPDRMVRAAQAVETVPEGMVVQPRAERAEHKKTMNEHSTQKCGAACAKRARRGGPVTLRSHRMAIPATANALGHRRGQAFGHGSSGADNAPKGLRAGQQVWRRQDLGSFVVNTAKIDG